MPCRPRLDLSQDVRAKLLLHQSAQARFGVLDRGSTSPEAPHQQRQLPAFDQGDQDCLPGPVEPIEDWLPIQSPGSGRCWVINRSGYAVVQRQRFLTVLTVADRRIHRADQGTAVDLRSRMVDIFAAATSAAPAHSQIWVAA